MPRHVRNLTQDDRNLSERERRKSMKELISRLAFLIPTPHHKGSMADLVDEATAHIKEMKERVEMLKQRMGGGGSSRSSSTFMITVCDMDSVLQLSLTTTITHRFILSQLIDLLLQEAAEVVALAYFIVGDSIFYTIHAQAVSARIGIEISRVQEKLEELILNPTTPCN